MAELTDEGYVLKTQNEWFQDEEDRYKAIDPNWNLDASTPDGMKIDQEGNIYCTGPGGLWVIDPKGECLGRIVLPELPANMAWGDEDWKTLYITARSSIYRLRLGVPGIPVS